MSKEVILPIPDDAMGDFSDPIMTCLTWDIKTDTMRCSSVPDWTTDDNLVGMFDEKIWDCFIRQGGYMAQCKFCGDGYPAFSHGLRYGYCSNDACEQEMYRVSQLLRDNVILHEQQEKENERIIQEDVIMREQSRVNKEVIINIPKPKKVIPEKKEYLGPDGYVYLVQSEDGLCKIGISTRPEKRFLSLQGQSPKALKLLHTFFTEGYRSVERRLHTLFASQKSHFEWFNLTDEQIKWFCSLTDSETIPVQWI